MMLQVRERPFSNNELNNLENWSLGILFLTLYLGLFFFWDLVQGTGRTLMGLSIIGFNILYILWLREKIAVRLGAEFTQYLGRNCSYLVCKKPEGAKYMKACSWPKIEIVTLHWLQECERTQTKILFDNRKNRKGGSNQISKYRFDKKCHVGYDSVLAVEPSVIAHGEPVEQ